MNKNAGLLLLLFVVNFLHANCLSQEKAGGEKLTVQVRVLKANLTGHKLRLSWKIANDSAKAVYVYATFLHGPAAAYETSDKDVLVVNTSLLRKSPVGVNFYPKAEFLELSPGALAPVRVMLSRSIFTYLAPSAPLAGTSGLHRLAAYTRCLRCAYLHRPRRPTTGSELSSMLFCNMSPSETTGNSSAAYTQYFTEDAGLQRGVKSFGIPFILTLRFW